MLSFKLPDEDSSVSRLFTVHIDEFGCVKVDLLCFNIRLFMFPI